MRHKKIYFDTKIPKWEDKVVVAVAPVDAFTGQVVVSGIKVRIKNPKNDLYLPDVPVRNLSGMHVFINLERLKKYKIIVDAEEAGYFSEEVEFDTPEDDDPDWKTKRRKNVALYKLPIGDVDFDVTTAAGIIVNGDQKLAGAKIIASLPDTLSIPGAQKLKPFETRSDERGAFALRLRLPDRETEVPVKFVFKAESSMDREIEISLKEGKYYRFNRPIDMAKSLNQGPQPLLVLPFGN